MSWHLRAYVIVLMALVTGGADATASRQERQEAGDRVVLVTIDGARTEEVFGGLDVEALKSTLKPGQRIEDTEQYRRFWAPTREERRRTLMPFVWGALVTAHGSIAGDATAGSAVRVRNRHWFSYPGYSEILLGEPHDDEVKSNDAIRNPHSSVLEGIRQRLNLPREQVATFASWGVFNQIVEHTEGATFVNAGLAPLVMDDVMHDADVRAMNLLQREIPAPWDVTRYDAITFRLAMKYLATVRPRVLYLAVGETDDFAHDGRYDRVLDAYARADGYLGELWAWLQAQPDYRGRTHLLITTDHGRGHTGADWRNHNANTPGSNEVWMAFASPRMAQRGIWRDHPPLSSSQIAATLASWMGVDWTAGRPNAGAPIR
jgi:hypothetical protein